MIILTYLKGSAGRLAAATAMFAMMAVLLLGKLMFVNLNREFYLAYDMSAPRMVEIVRSFGDITDRKGVPLVNSKERYIAVIDPETADMEAIGPHMLDRRKFDECKDGNALFLCEADCRELSSVTVIPVKERYSDKNICTHIIGYTDENGGVCGIEKAYGDVLGQPSEKVSLTYSADASGNFLEGSGIDMKWEASFNTGVATAIDYDIQTACEEAMRDVKKGAAVVMDIRTGEITAVVSKPSYDPSDPSESLDDPDSPFINRAFLPYSVGSVFKLVTAGAALEYGVSEDYTYDCRGSIKIRQDDFGCHRFGGHGEVDMRLAMVESCNPYFICLGRDIPSKFFRDFADRLGFGQEKLFAKGIYSASGNLPAEKELLVPEEKANFSFGQGKLTATPLQVTLMTAAIANDGQMPVPVLVHGVTDAVRDHEAVSSVPTFNRVMKSSTAQKLRSFMVSAVYKENSMGIPQNTTAGGKTSTAQTWTYDEYGNERLNCWFTGFFPAHEPRYAATVVIEDGISGNVTCGPVFAEIADKCAMEN